MFLKTQNKQQQCAAMLCCFLFLLPSLTGVGPLTWSHLLFNLFVVLDIIVGASHLRRPLVFLLLSEGEFLWPRQMDFALTKDFFVFCLLFFYSTPNISFQVTSIKTESPCPVYE